MSKRSGATRIPKFGSSRIPIPGSLPTRAKNYQLGNQSDAVSLIKETGVISERDDIVQEDTVSGPYSIIGIEEKCIKDKTIILRYDVGQEANKTLILDDRLKTNAQYVEEKNCMNVKSTVGSEEGINNTYIISDQIDDEIRLPRSSLEPLLGDSIIAYNKPSRVSTDSLDSDCKSPIDLLIACASTPVSKDASKKTKKRPNSLHCDESSMDESLGILSSSQMHFNFAQTKRLNSFHGEDASLDESLGILTPNQMLITTYLANSKTPSSENVYDESGKDFSLGIIDEKFISLNVSSNTTLTMELPLDSVNKLEVYDKQRFDQTPSPEDLPLDPIDSNKLELTENVHVIFNPDFSESKTDVTKSKTISSFITSVTSITSLDTGYQGDGEMSRPASRGPDLSPLTRRPMPTYRPQPRRPDPMTDSDFYTESDADNHDEHPLRGDRRAQVIDGTLYGVDPQAAADIYVNNRENMDSSGVFTDIESNTRADELLDVNSLHPTLDNSPIDSSSSKTLSDNSQGLLLNVTVTAEDDNLGTKTADQNAATWIVPPANRLTSPTASLTSSSASTNNKTSRLKNQDAITNRHKMPKKNVTSKVKTMLELPPKTTNNNNNINSKVDVVKRNVQKKAPGRWDAVMNKISKGTELKTNLKEVKSKVFTSATPVKTLPKKDGSATGHHNRQGHISNATRRMRTRVDGVSSNTNTTESINSSLSDLSGSTPRKTVLGSSKKQREVVKVTQVLTPGRINQTSRNVLQIDAKHKKSPTQSPKLNKDTKTPGKRKLIEHGNNKKVPLGPSNTNKDCGRTVVKGGRVSPGSRPPQQPRAPVVPIPKTSEALAVLVQHLVFNLEAFRGPTWKRQAERGRLDAEEARLCVRQLEETLCEVKHLHAETIEQERARWRSDIAEINERHRANISELHSKHVEVQQRLSEENVKLQKDHDDKLKTLKSEIDILRNAHEQTVDILREENDSVREEIDEKNLIIERLQLSKFDSDKLRNEFEMKEKKYLEQLQAAGDEIEHNKEENRRIMNSFKATNKDQGIERVLAEVESLRAVLELKQNEVAELRKEVVDTVERAEQLHVAEERIMLLTARCEDLQLQLERKADFEQQLLNENRKLRDSYKEEWNQKKRLSQYNEELQWKLQQNKEVVTRVLEQAEETVFSRSNLSSSFSERHNSPARQILERTLSFREKPCSNKSINESNRTRRSNRSLQFEMEEEVSPPSSPKVKGVVEKSDSVSYVLEMDESPEIVANRIVRRSFRNTTPPKSTPTKCPANKRPRMKSNPLSQSASASAIIGGSDNCKTDNSGETDSNTSDDNVFSSWTVVNDCSTAKKKLAVVDYKFDHNLDLDDDDAELLIHLPALPSELENSKNPKHPTLPLMSCSGEGMHSDTNSDDDSNASSSSGHL